MDAGGRWGERFQVPERSGNTETFFLCASPPEFLSWGGPVYTNAATAGGDRPGAGGREGRAGIDSSTRHPFVQGEPARPASLRLGIGRHDRRLARSLFLARLARDADRSSPGVAGLILCIQIFASPAGFEPMLPP